MKPLNTLAMLALILAPMGASAQQVALQAQQDISDPAPLDQAASPSVALGVGPHQAADVAWEAQLYHSRPLVIFADSPENPQFLRQLQLIERDLPALAERRVMVILDADPAAASDWRRRLRPHGFSLVLLDTDLRPVIRKPSPWDVREISRTIDRLPSRRQDVLQQFPSGR